MVLTLARVVLDQDVNLVVRIPADLMKVPAVLNMLSACGNQVYHTGGAFLDPPSRLQASTDLF